MRWMEWLLPFCLLAFFPLLATAQDKVNQFNAVEHAVISQTIAPDARSAGMGDVGVATDPDVNSQYWNPAKYPFAISRAGVALNYTPWLRQLVNDMDLAYLSGYYRIGDYSAVSGSLRYFSLGEVFLSEAENAMTIKPYEMSFDVAYSMMLSEKFSWAAALRFIYSDLTYDYTDDTKPGTAFAADLGLYYQNYLNLGDRECQLGLGMNVSNIGSKLSYNGGNDPAFLPTNLKLGTSFTFPLADYHNLTLSLEGNKLLVPLKPKQSWYLNEDGTYNEEEYGIALQDWKDKSSIAGIFDSFHDAPGGGTEELREINLSVGAEYVYNQQFFLRGGYFHENKYKGNRQYFGLGAGFSMNVLRLDAAYIIATAQNSPLDQTLRFTLSFDMDGIKNLFGGR